jgi:Protein of unknown function (DUF5132)
MGPVVPGAVLLLVGVGLGAAGKRLLRAAAPRAGRASRPFVRATIRQGVLLQREIQRLVESVREDIEDVTAEAVQEAEGLRGPNDGSPSSNRA